jgi:hypothetical protein
MKKLRSSSPQPRERAKFRERVALRLLERPASPLSLPDVVSATTHHQPAGQRVAATPLGGLRSQSAALFDILKNHTRGIVSRPTTTAAPLIGSRAVSLEAVSRYPNSEAIRDPSSDALASALAVLRDRSVSEKDFSLLCIVAEDCPAFFEALGRASCCRVVNLQGAALPAVAQGMLLRAVRTNPTPIAEVILSGSTLAAAPGLLEELRDICAANAAKKQLDEEAALCREMSRLREAAQQRFAEQRRVLEETIQNVRNSVSSDQRKEMRQLRDAWQLAKRVAQTEEAQRHLATAFGNGWRELIREQKAARAAVAGEWHTGFANLLMQRHAALADMTAAEERKERRAAWRRYCAGWQSSTQLCELRMMTYAVEQRKLMVAVCAAREELVREELLLRQTMLEQRVVEYTNVKRGEFEAKQRKDDERRRTRQKQTEEEQHLEHQRSKARAEQFRASESRLGGQGSKGKGVAELEATTRAALEDVEALCFKLLNAARRAVERAVHREERFFEAGRHFQDMLRQPCRVEFRINRTAPYTSTFVGNRACVPIETGLRLYLSMDPLWVVRASVLRDEVDKYYNSSKTARKESLSSISSLLQEAETKLRIEKMDIQWPRAVRQFLNSGKKNLQEFAEALLGFSVADVLARKETIFSGRLELSLAHAFRDLGDLVVVEKEHSVRRERTKATKGEAESVVTTAADCDLLSVEDSDDSQSSNSSLSELSEDEPDEGNDAAFLARIQKNFLRCGPRPPRTWHRVTEGDTTSSVRLHVGPVEVESGSEPLDPEAIVMSPGECIRSRSKAVTFAVPTRATAIDLEEAIRSVRFVLRPHAKEHFQMSPEIFEIGVVNVSLTVFVVSHRLLLRRPVRWPSKAAGNAFLLPRPVATPPTDTCGTSPRMPLPSPRPPSSAAEPVGLVTDITAESFDSTTRTVANAVAKWKAQRKSFPRLAKVESRVDMCFLIGRKIINIDQELVVPHDARAPPVSLLQDPCAVVIWEPPVLVRGTNRFQLVPATNASTLDRSDSGYFGGTLRTSSELQLARHASSSLGPQHAFSVFRRAAVCFKMTQRATDSSEDVLFLQNTAHLEACDGRITYVSNYKAFQSTLLEGSELALGAQQQSTTDADGEFAAQLEAQVKHQPTNVQVGSFTSQATEIFIQFVFPVSLDVSIVREVLEMVCYKNTSVAPRIGPRHVHVRISSDFGVEDSALIVIDVSARDDPTTWTISGPVTLTYTLPISQRHAATILGDTYSTDFQPKLGRPLSAAPLLWDYVDPPTVKIASGIDVIDDDTTFFSGGYVRLQLKQDQRPLGQPVMVTGEQEPPLPPAGNIPPVLNSDLLGFFEVDDDHKQLFRKSIDAPLSSCAGVGLMLDIPQQRAPFGLSMALIHDHSEVSCSDYMFSLFDDAWPVATVRLVGVQGSIRRPAIARISVAGGHSESAATDEAAEEEVFLASDIFVEFVESPTGATIDTIQELLRVVTFCSIHVRGEEAMARRVACIELLVGATTARCDILGRQLPDTKVNQPLQCAFAIEARESFASTADDNTSVLYRENSGPMFLFDGGVSIPRSFVGGFLRLDILSGQEAEDTLTVADRSTILAERTSNQTSLVVPPHSNDPQAPRPRSVSAQLESLESLEASEFDGADCAGSPATGSCVWNSIRVFSADECCTVAARTSNVGHSFELASFAKVNMMTVNDVIQATSADSPTASLARRKDNSGSESSSMSLSHATAAAAHQHHGGRLGLLAQANELATPNAQSKTLPTVLVPSADTGPVRLGRKQSILHNPSALIDSSAAAHRQQAGLAERQREIISRSTDNPSFQATLASGTSARRSSFRQLARQKSIRGGGSSSPLARGSPQTLLDHRIASQAAQELIWANRMKRIMIARNSKFTYLLAKSCYRLVQDRKEHLAAIGLDVALVQPDALEEFSLTMNGMEVGTAIVKNSGLVRSVVIVFEPNTVITPSILNAIFRTVSYSSSSRNPHFLRKYVRATLHVDDEGDTNILVPIEIQPFDDPTEILLHGTAAALHWRPGCTELTAPPRQFGKSAPKSGATATNTAARSGGLSVNSQPPSLPTTSSGRSLSISSALLPKATLARKEGLGALQLFPAGSTIISDPDTTHWDGGSIEISINNGFVDGLDSLMIFTIEQQLLIAGTGPSATPREGGPIGSVLLVDVSPPFVAPPARVFDVSAPHAADGQLAGVASNMQTGVTRSLRILRAVDRTVFLDGVATVSVRTEGEVTRQRAVLLITFTAANSVFERRVALPVVQLIVHSLGFYTLESPLSASSKVKTLSISITDEDNINRPGIRKLSVSCSPVLLSKPVDQQRPIFYSLKSAQDAKQEMLFLGLQSKCFSSDKDRFPLAAVEVFAVSGFSAGDKLIIKPSMHNFTVTQDGIVLYGKEIVARNMIVIPSSVKFDVTKDCRGATWPRILQLLSVIGYSYDTKEVTKSSGVGGRDITGEALFPSCERMVCLQVTEQKAAVSPSLPVGQGPSTKFSISVGSSDAGMSPPETGPAKRNEAFCLLQRISTTEGISMDQ